MQINIFNNIHNGNESKYHGQDSMLAMLENGFKALSCLNMFVFKKNRNSLQLLQNLTVFVIISIFFHIFAFII